MLDALKALFENNAISEEIRAEIEQAWEQRIQENRLSATAELREEFAQKYEHDKATMVEAIDTMLEEKLAEELNEESKNSGKSAGSFFFRLQIRSRNCGPIVTSRKCTITHAAG